MAKRIKRVFSSADQVIHLWANQSQTDARCKNVFFNGKSIYSYGRHYELGRLVEYKGKTAAMINDQGYSKTTSKHIHSAFHACQHMLALKTKGDLDDVKGALLSLQGEIVDMLFNHFNKRSFWSEAKFNTSTKDTYGEMYMVARFNNYCDQFDFNSLKLDLDQDFIGLFNAHIKIQLNKEELKKSPEAIAKKIAAENKRSQKQAEKLADKILTWQQGGVLVRELRQLEPQKIRVFNNEVQTTRGASVPLNHAVRLLRLIITGKAKTGERIGPFTLSMVYGDTVKVGCHTFSLSDLRATLEKQPTLSLVQGA